LGGFFWQIEHPASRGIPRFFFPFLFPFDDLAVRSSPRFLVGGYSKLLLLKNDFVPLQSGLLGSDSFFWSAEGRFSLSRNSLLADILPVSCQGTPFSHRTVCRSPRIFEQVSFDAAVFWRFYFL